MEGVLVETLKSGTEFEKETLKLWTNLKFKEVERKCATCLLDCFLQSRHANAVTGNHFSFSQIPAGPMIREIATTMNTFRDDHTTERVSGGRQYSVDDIGALVHKFNELSSLIIQR
jgi:hypothetical protein